MCVWVMMAVDKNEDPPEMYLEGVYMTEEKAVREKESKRAHRVSRGFSFRIQKIEVEE